MNQERNSIFLKENVDFRTRHKILLSQGKDVEGSCNDVKHTICFWIKHVDGQRNLVVAYYVKKKVIKF